MKLYAFTRTFLNETGASMHLALAGENGPQPLNSGFGMLFPKADFVTNDYVGVCKGLLQPWVFPWQGGYAVIALRCEFERGRAVTDPSAANSILFFTTKDLCAYEEKALLPLAPQGCEITDVRACATGCGVRIFAQWDGAWHAFDTCDMTSFTPAEAGEIPQRVAISCADAMPACCLDITDEEADFLLTRLTPAQLPANAQRYPFPMMRERGDPMAFRWKDGYLFAATDDERGQRRLLLRYVKNLADIPTAEDHPIFHANDEGDYSGCIWAPELHMVNGKLCIFFAAGMPHWYTVQSRVIILEGDDPLNPDCWSKPRRMETPSGGALTHTGITLDMTVIHTKLGDYVCWSQRVINVETLKNGSADLFIAKLNMDEPWRLLSEPVCLARPEYGWERIGTEVLEGPFVLRRGDTIYMTYAAALIDHTYAVGVLVAQDGDDLLDLASWRKSNYPLVHRFSMPDQLGGGHNAFVQDEMGNDVMLIHALSKENYIHHPTDGRRFPTMRQVVWDKHDFPHLDAR